MKLFAGATRAVRAHNMGIEVYDISAPTAILNLGTLAGTTSTTGAGGGHTVTVRQRSGGEAVDAFMKLVRAGLVHVQFETIHL